MCSCQKVMLFSHCSAVPTGGLLARGLLTLLRAQPAPLHVPGHSQWWPTCGPPAAEQTVHTHCGACRLCVGDRGWELGPVSPQRFLSTYSMLLITADWWEATCPQECPYSGGQGLLLPRPRMPSYNSQSQAESDPGEVCIITQQWDKSRMRNMKSAISKTAVWGDILHFMLKRWGLLRNTENKPKHPWM
jgi:hypothetical protein